MAYSIFIHFLTSLMFYSTFAAASTLGLAKQARNLPGTSDSDTYLAIQRSLVSIRKRQDQDVIFNVSKSVQRSWNDQTLLPFSPFEEDSEPAPEPQVQVVCTKCYITGNVHTELSVDSNFNVSDALVETIHDIGDAFNDTISAIADAFHEYTDDMSANFSSFANGDLGVPDIDVPLEMNITSTPEASFQIRFDGLEIYLQLQTIVAAGSSITIPLFETSPTTGPLKGLHVATWFTIDLILDVRRTVSMSSGLHLRLEDGIAIAIDLFGDTPSEVMINEGQFRFLPVTIESDGAAFAAILRVGAHFGLGIETPQLPFVEAGIEVAIFADILELVTDIIPTPENDTCKMSMSQEYSLALGAAAGATIALFGAAFGPEPATSTPIFFATKTGLCADVGHATPTTTPTPTVALLGRGDEETTILSTEMTQTRVICTQSVDGRCPQSLQDTTRYTTTLYLTTAVPSGQEAVWPTPTVSLVPFSSDFETIAPVSGSPVSYVPPAPSSISDSTFSAKEEKESSGRHNLQFGATLGLPLLATIATLIM